MRESIGDADVLQRRIQLQLEPGLHSKQVQLGYKTRLLPNISIALQLKAASTGCGSSHNVVVVVGCGYPSDEVLMIA